MAVFSAQACRRFLFFDALYRDRVSLNPDTGITHNTGFISLLAWGLDLHPPRCRCTVTVVLGGGLVVVKVFKKDMSLSLFWVVELLRRQFVRLFLRR